jgi:glutathione S-transferase
VLEAFFPPLRGIPVDEARVAKLTAAMKDKIVGYERILSKQRYLAGEQVTLADLFHLPWGSYLSVINVKVLEDEEHYPNVAR